MQCKIIIRIIAVLNFCYCFCASGNAYILTFKLYMKLIQLSDRNLHRINSVQLNCCIQNNATFFITVRRRIRPTAAPVYTYWQLYMNLILLNPVVRAVWKILHRILENHIQNLIKA